MFNYKLDHLRKMFSHRFSAFWLRSSEERCSQSPHPRNPWTFSVFWLQRSHQLCSLLLHPIHVPSWRCLTPQLSINMKNRTPLPGSGVGVRAAPTITEESLPGFGRLLPEATSAGEDVTAGPSAASLCPGAASTDRRCCGGVLVSVRSAPCALRGPLGPLLHRLVSAAVRLCVLSGNACQTSGSLPELVRAGAMRLFRWEGVAASQCDSSPEAPRVPGASGRLCCAPPSAF